MASRIAGPGTHTTSQVLTAAHMNNLPGGWIGHAQITADSATYTTTLVDISGLSQAVTVNTTRRIRVSVSLTVESGEAGAIGDLFIREGSTSLKKQRYQFAAGSGTCHVNFDTILTPSSGSHTYKVSAQRVTGTTTHKVTASTDAATAFGPADLLIGDLGPAS